MKLKRVETYEEHNVRRLLTVLDLLQWL